MPVSLSYCPHAEEVIVRMRRFYQDRAQDIILATMEVPNEGLAEFAAGRPAGDCEYPNAEDRILEWDRLLRHRIPLYDDYIPGAVPSEMDQGLYGALFGAEPRFTCFHEYGIVSSMAGPVVPDWETFERTTFRLDRDHVWFRRYLHQLDVFVAGAQGKFAVSNFCMINGMNMVIELVGGANALVGPLERPDLVCRALDLSHDLNVLIHDAFFERVPLLEGGTCAGSIWLPGRSVMESVDPFHLTSVDYFMEWGYEPLERMLTHYDGGNVHLHGNGHHLFDAVVKVKGLQLLWVDDDGASVPAYQKLADLRRRGGTVPLLVRMPYRDFVEGLSEHELIGGVHYLIGGVPDVDTANHLMERVREYRV